MTWSGNGCAICGEMLVNVGAGGFGQVCQCECIQWKNRVTATKRMVSVVLIHDGNVPIDPLDNLLLMGSEDLELFSFGDIVNLAGLQPLEADT